MKSRDKKPFLLLFGVAVAGLAGLSFAAQPLSFQTGTTALPLGASSVTVALSSIDLTRSFLTFNASFTGNEPGMLNVAGQLTSPTQLVFTRRVNPAAPAVTIKWYVAEFSSGVLVQRGGVDNTVGAPVTVTLATPVDLSRSFPLISYRSEGVVYDCNDFLRARLISTTQLEITYNDCANPEGRVEWQVVDYTGAVVTTGNAVFNNGDASQAVVVPAFPPASTWMVFTYQSDSGTAADIGQKMVRGRLSGGNTLTFDRDSTGQDIDLTWYLVQFTDGTLVQHGSAAFTAGALAQTAVLSPNVDPARTLATGGGIRYGGGKTTYAADDNPGFGMGTMDVTAPGTLTLTRGVSGSTADMGWFTVQFPPLPTPTLTSTSTASNTPTSTATSSATSTPTLTSTLSATSTGTSTPTMTPTMSATSTSTPDLTLTSTSTPSSSATSTSTDSATPTPSATLTATPSPTSTVTDTATSTATDTLTPTPSATLTATPSASSTSTPTDSTTPTPSATLTATPSASPTGTETSTSSPTSTASSTPSNTPTFTSTSTGVPTETSTASMTPTPSATLTATPSSTETETSSATPTVTPTPSLTATATDTDTGVPTQTSTETGTSTMTPTQTLTSTPTPSPTFTETQTPTHTPTGSLSATFTSTPTRTPTAASTSTPTRTPTATRTETSTRTETPTVTSTATGTLTPACGSGTVKVFDSRGELVQTFCGGLLSPAPQGFSLADPAFVPDPAGKGGTATLYLNGSPAGTWDATDLRGRLVPEGFYMVQLEQDLSTGATALLETTLLVVYKKKQGVGLSAFPNLVYSGDSVLLTGTFEGAAPPDGTLVRIHSVTGEKVRVLALSGGQTTWDLRNEAGRDVASGVYLIVLQAPAGGPSRAESRTVKVVVLR